MSNWRSPAIPLRNRLPTCLYSYNVYIMHMFVHDCTHSPIFLKDLIKDLASELSGNFSETIMALFQPTTYYDAWTLHNAMEVDISRSQFFLYGI